MLVDGEGLSKEIRQVGLTGDKSDVELELADPVPDPIETHIDGFGLFGPNGTVGKSNGTFVVTKNRGGGLRVAEVGQNLPLVYAKLRIGIDGGIFRLGHCTDYDRYEGRVAEHGGVQRMVVGVSKVMETTGHTS